METTVYLIRHSVRFNTKRIINNNSNQSKLLLNEKISLSVEGEKRAEILSNEEELQNINVVYASNCVRTLQTAKYLLEKQNLDVTIDERFDERRAGKPNDHIYKDWWVRQFIDENFKTEGGECQKDVVARFSEAFYEVLQQNEGKRIAIFSHGYAIFFFLMTWCKFEYLGEKDYVRLTYNDEVIYNKKISAPEVFKLIFIGDKLTSMECLEFEDLPYMDALG